MTSNFQKFLVKLSNFYFKKQVISIAIFLPQEGFGDVRL